MNRLLLVRHGESTWNAEHRLQGQADPELSELGREQAQALVPFLDGIPDRRLSSDLTRAVQTAELIGLGGRADRRALARDRHGRRGPATRSTSSIPSRSPPGSAASTTPPSRGSSSRPASAAAVDELHGEDVIVVTHGGCIRAATAHLTGADARTLAPPANASLTVIEHGDRVRLHAYGLRAPGPETPALA